MQDVDSELKKRADDAKKTKKKPKGGFLPFWFPATSNGYKAVVLQGPATPVYKGQWEITTK